MLKLHFLRSVLYTLTIQLSIDIRVCIINFFKLKPRIYITATWSPCFHGKRLQATSLANTVSLLRSYCMSAWCPTCTCNTPLLCCDPTNGPGLPSACHVGSGFFADSAVIHSPSAEEVQQARCSSAISLD